MQGQLIDNNLPTPKSTTIHSIYQRTHHFVLPLGRATSVVEAVSVESAAAVVAIVVVVVVIDETCLSIFGSL